MRRELLGIALVVAFFVLVSLVGELLREWRKRLHMTTFGDSEEGR